MSENVKKRIENLRKEITRLRDEYHIVNNPKVTDDVYESLKREFDNLLKQNPEYTSDDNLDRVAGRPLDKFSKVTHSSRMLSLNDAFSKDDLLDWEKRVKKLALQDKLQYFCELKLDGLAVSLIYENGAFKRGATRGDGFIGEDITENLKMIKSIPLMLSKKMTVEVRGEVVMKKSIWEKLNKEQIKNGLPTFANTRNAAAGSLRQLDPSLAKERNLDFFAYDIIGALAVTHSQKHKTLRELGFVVDTHESKANILDEVFKFIDEIGVKRDSFDYGTDGIVICVDDLDLQEKMGVAGKAPRYAVAFKYPAEKATTVVTGITVNVGRTGVLTPLAHFVPTLVAGSTVSKATLHNMDQINRLDIRIGDTVVIQKAGDVIPEVVEVLTNMRAGKEKKFTMPKNCPACGTEIIKKDIFYYCKNKSCSAKNKRWLEHFVNAFEIYEIGPKILERLSEEGLISDASDLFILEASDLSGLDRFGEKSADNIIKSIEEHKSVLLWRFIYALGILHVGEQTARDLADHFGTLSKLMNADESEINEVENIGPVVSKSIHTFFTDKNSRTLIDKILKNGVSIKKEEKSGNQNLKGKIFVLTGTLPTLAREDAKKKIIASGGKVSSSVSVKTDYVLAGEEAGSKLKDAQRLGVKIVSEQEFLKML